MSHFVTARQKMVDGQVRPSDVTDIRVIDAMLAVPREEYVPAELRQMAYLDIDLDLSEPGSRKRYLIKPVVLGRMLQAAEINRTDNVLVVGCSSGYTAAVVSHLAVKVTATADDKALAAKAAALLASAAISNVTFVSALAASGYAANGLYDVIVLAGASEIVPTGLYQQLAAGGRLVGVSAIERPSRAVIVTHSHDDFGSRPLFDATVPVLAGLERLPEFVF